MGAAGAQLRKCGEVPTDRRRRHVRDDHHEGVAGHSRRSQVRSRTSLTSSRQGSRSCRASQPRLATVRRDGRPHVAPVWFDLDGGDLVFSTGERSVKGRNLIADPRLSICVDDDQPPFAFVIVEGTAELSRDPAAPREWAGRIGARYLGVDETDRLAELNGGPGNLLVRVTPVHIVSESSITE
ncbi:MAG: PPOX class F420-dependent oxidoreductase [Pseudonocardiaceae bacterium]